MASLFVSDKTTRFYRDDSADEYEFVLIYGDEVEPTGGKANGRREVVYRGRTGWVKSSELGASHPLEVYFIDVGQGDAVFIVTPGFKKILIDGGKDNEAFQFLVWKYRLDLANATPVDIDLLVLTHADEDHIRGLVPIVKHNLINVKQIWHSGIAKYASGEYNTQLGDVAGDILTTRHSSMNDLQGKQLEENMTAWRNAIAGEVGVKCTGVDSTYSTPPFAEADLKIDVLGPLLVDQGRSGAKGYPWFSSASKTVNGNSVVLRVVYKDIRLLFPGDINKEGALRLLGDVGIAGRMSSDVLKAPHHGSHEFDKRFLEAVGPQITVISSGEEPDHGHPRETFLAFVGSVSQGEEPLLFCTALNAQFVVDADAASSDADQEADPTNPAMLGQARRRFKKRLNGLVNVRTDGKSLFAAKRVAASYQFVAYGPTAAKGTPPV